MYRVRVDELGYIVRAGVISGAYAYAFRVWKHYVIGVVPLKIL